MSSTVVGASPAPDSSRGSGSGAGIAAALLGVFICLLDTNIVNVALPDIQRELNASLSASQWAVSLYILMLAALIVCFGALADVFDIRKIYATGSAAFGIGSLVCACAGLSKHHGVAILLTGRAAQGLGAAVVLPLSMALVFKYSLPRTVHRNISLWSAISGLSVAVGPLVGGVLVDRAGWEWIFLINCPIVVVELVLLFKVPAPYVSEKSRFPSLLPIISLGVAAFALTFGLIQGPLWGWGDFRVLSGILLGVCAAVCFVLLERTSPLPLVSVTMRRNRGFQLSLVAAFVTGFAAFSMFFFISFYLQFGLHVSATDTGLRFLPMSGTLMLFAVLGRRLVARLGMEASIACGFLLAAVGLFLLVPLIGRTNASPDDVIVPSIVLGVGVGISFPTSSALLLQSISQNEFSTGSSVLTMVRQIGNTAGIAILGIILAHLTEGTTPDPNSAMGWIGCTSAILAIVGAFIMFACRQNKDVESHAE